MKKVISISGGKSSAYMASNYEADYLVFALVCIDYPKATPKDKKLVQAINDKLQKYCPHQPEFIATPEHLYTLLGVFDLEDYLGKEVIWLRGDSFDEVIRKRKMLPNKAMRFCTSEMKMRPIMEWWYKYIGEKCQMGIGFRHDEAHRANRFTIDHSIPLSCSITGAKRQSWKEFNWREGWFPLIEDKVDHYKVKSYWEDRPVNFPYDSNCSMCFWKPNQQLRKNFDDNPFVMEWAKHIEAKMGNTFKKEYSLEQIARLGLELSFNFGTGSGCQAGFCTD